MKILDDLVNIFRFDTPSEGASASDRSIFLRLCRPEGASSGRGYGEAETFRSEGRPLVSSIKLSSSPPIPNKKMIVCLSVDTKAMHMRAHIEKKRVRDRKVNEREKRSRSQREREIKFKRTSEREVHNE